MTNKDRNLLYRVGLLSQQRPLPPRSVRFGGDLVLWDEPSEVGNITHYNVRVGSDTADVRYRVPVGTTSIRPGLKDENFFISSYNATMKSESSLVAIAGQPPDMQELDDALSTIISELGEVTIATSAVTKTRNADGTITVTIPYAPPYVDPIFRTIGNFAGVHRAYEQSGTVEVFGDQPYNGNAQADPPGNLGTATITRRWTAPETFYAHLMSWASDGRRLTFITQSLAPLTRVVAVEITQADLVGYPESGAATALSATVLSTRVDQSGKQWAKIRLTYTRSPGMEVHRVYAYLGASLPTDVADWGQALAESTGTRVDFEVESIEAGGTYQLALTSSPRGFTVPVTDETPTTSVVVAAWGAAPHVINFEVQQVETTRQGVPVTDLLFIFNSPGGTNWAGVKFQWHAVTSLNVLTGTAGWLDFTGVVTNPVRQTYGAKPSSPDYRRFRAVSVTPAGQFNTTDAPTAFVTIAAGAGLRLDEADPLTYTSDFSFTGGRLTVAGVNFALAYGFDTGAFEVSAGAFRVKEIAAEKIVTGTLGAAVIYAGVVNLDKLIGTSASFSSDITIARSSNNMQLTAAGVALAGGGSSVALTASGLTMAGAAGGAMTLSSTDLVMSWGAGSVAVSSFGIVLTGGVDIGSGSFSHAGSSVSITNKAAWRAALSVAWSDHAHVLTYTCAGICPVSVPADLPTDGSATLSDTVNKLNTLLGVMRGNTTAAVASVAANVGTGP